MRKKDGNVTRDQFGRFPDVENEVTAGHIPQPIPPAPPPDPVEIDATEQQRQWTKQPPATIIADTKAAAKLYFDYEHRPQIAMIEFGDGKPSDAIRQVMKDAGFKWKFPDAQSATWQLAVRLPSREQDRATAFATFGKVSDMLREEKAVGQSPE